MALLVLSIPLPESTGLGPAVDVSAIPGEKTIIIPPDIDGSYVLLGSHDNVNFSPITAFNGPGTQSAGGVIEHTLRSIRFRAAGTCPAGSTASASGTSSPGSGVFAAFPPVLSGSTGPQLPVDVVALSPSGLVSGANIMVSGTFVGTLAVEGSSNGSTYNTVATFQSSGASSQFGGIYPPSDDFSPLVYLGQYRYLRVNVANGTQVVGTLTITLGGEGASQTSSAISTISDLRTLTQTGGSVILAGFYSPGDGGGGTFAWDATSTLADNGGTIIRPNHIPVGEPGRWVRQYNGAVDTRWFGVVGNGAADDTVNFNKSRTAAREAGNSLLIWGQLKITSQLTISNTEHWIFSGAPGNFSGSRPTSYLVKAASVLGDLVTITAGNTEIDSGGVVGVVGNTGCGITVLANGVLLNQVYVEKCGLDGIRIGSDVPGSPYNSNWVTLLKCVSSGNGRHGIHVSDGDNTAPTNANLATIVAPLVQGNQSHGLYINKSAWTLVLNPLAELNAGYGIYLDAPAMVTISGGDTEQNVTGDFFVANPNGNQVFNLDAGGFTYTTSLETGQITAAITGRDLVLNGDFSSSVGWELLPGATISGGSAHLDALGLVGQRLSTSAGAKYRVSFTATSASVQGMFAVGSNGPHTNNLVSTGYLTTATTYTYEFTAVSENTWITLFNDISGTPDWTISEISVWGAIKCSASVEVQGLTGRTLSVANSTPNGTVATTLGSKGPVGSAAGDPVGWILISVGGADHFVPYW